MREIIRGIEQGSEAWQQLRLGIPTASAFDRILTPKKLEPISTAGACTLPSSMPSG